MSIIDDLPNDCWLHIFGYLNIRELKKYSLSISQNLALRLLETEDHNSIYRHLCEVQMRQDLVNALEAIENRKITHDNRYYYPRTNRFGVPVISRTNTSTSGLSSKQMRENLKHCTIRAKSLFSSWFKEDPSLFERITKAFDRSFSSNTIFIPDTQNHETTPEAVERLTKIKENEKEKLEKTLNDFILDLEKQVEKQKKKRPKWKQIWNGYYVQNSYSTFKKSAMDVVLKVSRVPTRNRRNRMPPPTTEEFEQNLNDIYEGLSNMDTETRRDIMFKNFKVQFRYYADRKYQTSKSSLFSQIVTGVYKFSKTGKENKNIEKIYGKLIEFFIEESIAHKVEVPILIDCYLPNNSPIHMLLKTTSFPDLGLKIVRKYARYLRSAPLGFRVFLLAKCFSSLVDLRIINELFYNNTFCNDVMEQTFRKNTITHYYLAAIGRKAYSPESAYYFADVFNIFVKCFQNNIGPNFTATQPVEKEMPTLYWASSQKLKHFLEPAVNYTLHYNGDILKFFVRVMNSHYIRFNDTKPARMLSDETPIHDFVHFEKPKFDDLNDFRRRKY